MKLTYGKGENMWVILKYPNATYWLEDSDVKNLNDKPVADQGRGLN